MLTITNRLTTHLVIPNGVGADVALKLGPKGRGKVEKVTASLKEAENAGLVTIRYPGGKPSKGRGSEKE